MPGAPSLTMRHAPPERGRTGPFGRALAIVCLLVASFALPSGASACTVTVSSGIAFGAYDVFSATALDSVGTLLYNCDGRDKNIRIELTAGGGGSYWSRALRNGSDQLRYNLYVDSARTLIWGDGSGGTGFYFQHNPPNRTDILVRIYARIPPGQDVSPGQYSDSVTVTVNF